ncbi:hypothetical protein BDZ94DRAFT_1247828 [Collybia nuda]|uniref:F-box domain-containing protein n=1 Tax=Collybia nuda TaxID=64659 RepID=A0A9P6CIW5_9AGAR|nr:hypothetical protein BDZ94DRAFT_1247828 [Collybia nuda]
MHMEPITEETNVPHTHPSTAAESIRSIGPKNHQDRAKRFKSDTTSESTTVIAPILEPPALCLLSRLPLELLAEILIYTCSPKDVLAVARTSKYFCDTLLSSPSMFIWRGTRQACLPRPLPDPMSIFTESSYASFLFDGGPCEICHTLTVSMYKSFAIRLRLCGKRKCTTEFMEMAAAPTFSEFDQAVGTLVPFVESNETLKLTSVGVDHNLRIFRGIDWVQEGSRYSSLSAQEIISSNAPKIKYVSALMKFSKSLREWEAQRKVYRLHVKSNNEKYGKSLASKYGWEYWDMINCTPYGDLHRHKIENLQHVNHFDYDQLAPVISNMLLKVAEKRKRQAKEATYRENRSGVAQHYNRLRSKKPPLKLPTLPTFRKLPIVAMVQSSEATSLGAAATLKGSSWVSERLDIELKNWLDQAKGTLGTVLGYLDWSTASTKILHPVDRITARFLCEYCGRLPLRYRDDECLDFAGACSHECRTSKRQRQRDEAWDARRFVSDKKAINAMSKLAALCGADPMHEECQTTINNIAAWVLCLSCKPGIIMCSRSVVGHSHRHDDMEMILVAETKAQDILASYPFVYGTAQNLLETSYIAKKLRALKNYGCRLCLAASRIDEKKSASKAESPSRCMKIAPTVINSPQKVKESGSEKTKPYKRPYTFDGMRSHVKGAHNIEHIRSEDFFCYNALDWGLP